MQRYVSTIHPAPAAELAAIAELPVVVMDQNFVASYTVEQVRQLLVDNPPVAAGITMH